MKEVDNKFFQNELFCPSFRGVPKMFMIK